MARLHAAAFALCLLAAAAVTWPLAAALDARLLGHPFGDAGEYTRHIWWIGHALQTGQPIFFQPYLGWPSGLPGAWLWAIPLQSFPAWLLALALPLPAAFNAQALLTLALNGWAMFALVKRLTGQAGAALVAGLIFLAYPAAQGQLAATHVGLLALWPAPLCVYALDRARDNRRWVFAAGALFTASLWGSPLLLVYVTGPLTLLLALRALLARDRAALVNVGAAAGLGLLLALPFLLPYALETRSAPPWVTAEGGAAAFSADLLGLVTPLFYHPLFADLDYSRRALGVDPFERVAYMGIVAATLAAVGARRQRAACGWLALALAAWALSLGPLLRVGGAPLLLDVGGMRTHIVLPWALIGELPLLNMTRTPARFNLLIGLALAVAAGYGAAALLRRPWRARWSGGALALALGALILFEYQSFWPLPTVPAAVPAAVRALRDRADVRAVYDVPWDHLLAAKDGLYLQTVHHKPLIAGQIARRTPVNPALLAVLQGTLDAALLDAAQVDVIILHREWDDGQLEPLLRARLGEPSYEDARLALFEPPAPAGPPPFAAVYEPQVTFTQFYDIHLHAPAPGWVIVGGALDAAGQPLLLSLDRQAALRIAAQPARAALDAPLYIASAGYHTLRLETALPCPAALEPLACRAARVDGLALAYTPAAATALRFGRGVTLTAARAAAAADGAAVQLDWAFDQPLAETDRRFVHVLDAGGQLVAQDDAAPPPGLRRWADGLRFELPPGRYQVYAGWYSLPDAARFGLLEDAAADGRALVGRVTVAGAE